MTLTRAIRAELVKLRTVRSTYLTLASAFALALAIGLTDCRHIAHGGDRTGFDPVGTPLDGFQFAQLAFGVFGVVAVSTEYATGLIRSTFAAVPGRGAVFAAKALAVGGVALLAGEVFVFAAFGAGQALLSGTGLHTGLGGPGVPRALVTAGVYLAVVAIVGLGLGALIRHTAGAVSAMFALIFLAWPVARAAESWSYLPDRLLLANAADVLGQAHAEHTARIPSLGFAYVVLIGYAVLACAVGAWRMSRDA